MCSSDLVRWALDLLASGRIRPDLLIAARRPLSAVREVFDALDRGAGPKVALIPDAVP